MTARASTFWKWVLIIEQVILVAEEIATRVTPYARKFYGWSAYAAMLCFVAWAFLFFGSPFLWRSHRWLAISGSGIAVGMILLSFTSSW
jgi:hypothetical protein